MKTRKSVNLTFKFLLVASALTVHVLNSGAANRTWSGLSIVTNLWSDTNNWAGTVAPGANDGALLGNAGSTNVQGAVNNVVDTNLTLTNLVYSALFTNLLATNYQTTLINPGVTLTVTGKGAATNFFYVGSGVDSGLVCSNWTTITGAGGTLVLGDPASPKTNESSTIQIKQTSVASGTRKAILDLSGLDNFIFAAGKFVIAGDGTFGGIGDRPQGQILLAKTNVITCAFPRYTDPSTINSQPFTIGYSQGSQSATTVTNLVQLGQQNTINADYLKIGGLKLIGQMSFRPGLVNPTLKIRGKDGVSRVPRIVIGDHGEARIVSFVCKGNMDLRGGIADILVNEMDLGINGWRDNATDTGSAGGVLTLDGGTLDVTTLNVGCQQGDNLGNASGILNVRTNGTLIAGNINIGRKSGTGGTGTGSGSMTINGGTVNVTGNVTENDGVGASGTSSIIINTGGTLNMMPPGDTVPGNITVDTLNMAVGTITNYGILGITNLIVTAPATEFDVYPGQSLAPGKKGFVATLVVKSNLTLNSATLLYDLVDPSSANDQIVLIGTNLLTLNGVNTVDVSAASGTIAPGTYTLMTYGSLLGDTNNLQVTGALAGSRYSFVFDTNTVPNINLTVSGGPTSNLTWYGDGAANVWDLKTAMNWNTNSEKFYALDTVTFDDTSTNSGVTLTGSLLPASVTVNGTSNYTFSGSGKISGTTGLIDNDTGKLTLATLNDYTGDTTLNAGTVLVNGALGVTTVTVNSGATLGGTGTILGPVTVQSGAIFSPGASIGTLAISNNLVLGSGSTSIFEANMDTSACDQVIGLRTVAYDGTLSLVLSGRPLVGGDALKLFSATTLANAFSSPYGGAFASISPATPGGSLVWNTSTLATDGTLRVVDPTPTSIAAVVLGNQLTLSWPADHVGWRLQRQITTSDVGFLDDPTKWVNVSGSTTTSSITVTIDPTVGAAFYRLVYPSP